MKILAVGDVVGNAGTEYIRRNLWNIRREYGIDFTVLNAENAAKGNGLDRDSAETLLASGADVLTSGNHIWRKHEMKHIIDDLPYVLRPENYPSTCPGTGHVVYDLFGKKILVISLLGNVFMPDAFASPFETASRLLDKYDDCFTAILDFHAETTSEKAALAKYLDGRAGVVFGTHTHVQTNDACVLPGGTGFVTDVGMVGVNDSILGVKNECILQKFLTQMPVRFDEPEGDILFCGAVFTLNDTTGRCEKAELIRRIG